MNFEGNLEMIDKYNKGKGQGKLTTAPHFLAASNMCIGRFPQDATTLGTTFPLGVNIFSNYRTVLPSSTKVSTYIVRGIFLAQLLLTGTNCVNPLFSCFGLTTSY